MTTDATIVPPGRSGRLFTIEPSSDRLTIIDAAGATVASTTTAAVAAVQAAAIASEHGSAFVCDSADRCIEITRTPAGFNIAGARDTRWTADHRRRHVPRGSAAPGPTARVVARGTARMIRPAPRPTPTGGRSRQ